jgi:antirestriction protein ArdC
MMSVTRDHPELLAQLTDGISRLADSDRWRRHLACQGRFHRYSFSNVLLIAAQRHGASQVAGFKAWGRLGRTVRRGEKAIWIVAPVIYRKPDGHDPDAHDPAAYDPAAYDPADREIRGFRYVPVFDISQTDGEELPTVCTKLAGGDPAGCFSKLGAVALSLGYTVDRVELADGVNGVCAFAPRHIRIEMRNSPAQQVKTLAHEIAHALLHEGEGDRHLAELEAESTAYIVCQVLGIDAGDYSFGYVTTWAGGGEQAIAGIKASCDHIQKTAATILAPFGADDERAA